MAVFHLGKERRLFLKIAVYSKCEIIEIFLKNKLENFEVVFSCKDIEKGRELAKEYNSEFYTCFVRMANSLDSGDVLILADDYKEFEEHIFKDGINVILKEYPIVPSPIAWFDNSYMFEIEDFIEKTKNANVIVAPYFNTIPVSMDSKIEIHLNQKKVGGDLSAIGRGLLRLISDNFYIYKEEDIMRHIVVLSGENKISVDGYDISSHYMNEAFARYCLSVAKKGDHFSFDKGIIIKNIEKTGNILKNILDFS